MIRPTFKRELDLIAAGAAAVFGCDEVGRGCLAGPVVAAAVIMPPVLRRGWKSKIRDSKTMSRLQRQRAAAFIREHAREFAIGEADAATIDAINIHHASLEAMRWAVGPLISKEEVGVVGVLVDGRFTIPNIRASGADIVQRAIVDGDAYCLSIAAASIIAKEYRDELMERLHEAFPHYGFAAHKGYATSAHRAAIRSHGLSVYHRRSFCSAYL